MASLNNSGIKEMSSSNVGRSYAGSGGKDGLGGFSYGASIELKDPVITFEDMRQEVKDYCFKLAEDSISKLRSAREQPDAFQSASRVHQETPRREVRRLVARHRRQQLLFVHDLRRLVCYTILAQPVGIPDLQVRIIYILPSTALE